VVARTVLSLLVAAFAFGVVPVVAATDGEARVTYLTSASVYVDAGREGGLRIGDRLEIVRDGEVVAVVEVTDLSSRRASCKTLEGSPVVGDVVRLPAAAETPVEPSPLPAAGALTSSTRRPRRASDRKVRGRVGLRYLTVKDHAGSELGFSQPALDLRLDGSNIAGDKLDIEVDARSRRTARSNAGGSTEHNGETRIYRMSASVHDPASHWRVTLGRQNSPTLASINIFDGVLADLARPGRSVGAFSGTQPDPIDFGLSSEVREHGVYVRFHNQSQSSRRWSLATGVVGSYVDGTVNREFVFVQGLYSVPRFSAYLTEEVDYSRDWKAEAGENTFTSTSTFINLRYRAARNVDLRAGFDNRRNVRLYRDHVTPETEFDDTFRDGIWFGTSVRFKQRYQAGADVKTSTGGSAGTADSYTMTFRADRLTRSDLSVGYRGTHYTNDRVEGWLHSVRAGVALGSRAGLALTAGLRDDEARRAAAPDDTVTWVGIDFDVRLGPSWYFLASLERTDGDFEQTDQAYLGVTYRF
jgi:hypothetical protein